MLTSPMEERWVEKQIDSLPERTTPVPPPQPAQPLTLLPWQPGWESPTTNTKSVEENSSTRLDVPEMDVSFGPMETLEPDLIGHDLPRRVKQTSAHYSWYADCPAALSRVSLDCADFLAKQHARQLVLVGTGRSGISLVATTSIELHGMGINVVVGLLNKTKTAHTEHCGILSGNLIDDCQVWLLDDLMDTGNTVIWMVEQLRDQLHWPSLRPNLLLVRPWCDRYLPKYFARQVVLYDENMTKSKLAGVDDGSK